jgi:diadenosine tetraphosphate (Ap4A) HIT family hydrolase
MSHLPDDLPEDLPGDLPVNTAAALTAIRAAEQSDGRLPMPALEALGDIFPFDGELRVRRFDDPVLPEPARNGEAGRPCGACARPDDSYLWVDDRWRLTTEHGVGALLPAVVLIEPRAHLDLGDLDDQHAAELGRLTVAIERAITALDGIGRVHVYRWGDGGAHLHVWFIARPAGLLQLRGSCLPVWLDVLPPFPADVASRNLASVAQTLADTYGGRAMHVSR